MNEPYTYLVNETNDGAIRLSAPDGALPGIKALLLNAGYRTATHQEFRQALRNAALADAEAAEESSNDCTKDCTAAQAH